jgi:hypothetical protein
MTAAFEMTLETLRLNRPYYISSEVGNLSLFNSTGSTKPNILSFPLGSVKHNLPTPMRHDLVRGGWSRGGRLGRAGITPRVHSGPSPAFPVYQLTGVNSDE